MRALFLPGLIALNLLAAPALRAEFVGIPPEQFAAHYRAQQRETWCWASCAEMVLSWQNIHIPQSEIVSRIKGVPADAKGAPEEMVEATNGLFEDIHGDLVVVSGQFIAGAPRTTVVYNQLRSGRPVILTYKTSRHFGHAVVLTGAEVEMTPSGPIIHRIHVFDPYCYRSDHGPRGASTAVRDDALAFREYQIVAVKNQVILPGVGAVSGMILMDGTRL